MASFPTTPKTFATRSAGQTIASAHMNDVQDEVAAIEDGYLNGTARLNSSGSTVASLTVTGEAAFSSIVRMTAQPRCILQQQAALEIASGSAAALDWDTEVVDIGGLHAANSSAVIIPAGSSGTYLVRAAVQFSANSSGQRRVVIEHSGNESGSRVQVPAVVGSETFIQVSMVAVLNAGSTLVVKVLQDSGSTMSVANASASELDVLKLY